MCNKYLSRGFGGGGGGGGFFKVRVHVFYYTGAGERHTTQTSRAPPLDIERAARRATSHTPRASRRKGAERPAETSAGAEIPMRGRPLRGVQAAFTYRYKRTSSRPAERKESATTQTSRAPPLDRQRAACRATSHAPRASRRKGAERPAETGAGAEIPMRGRPLRGVQASFTYIHMGPYKERHDHPMRG